MKNAKRANVRNRKTGCNMDLFEYMREQKKETESPLASRLRPMTLDEMVGQQHIIGKDNYCTVRSRRISSAPSSSMDLREPERQRLRRLLPIPQAQNFYR